MKKKLPALALALAFLLGAGVFLYPTISAWLANLHATRLVQTYNNSVADMADEESAAAWKNAEDYNQALANGAADSARYIATLNLDDGIMGHVSIPAIEVQLPIYHTTDEEILQKGIGHMEGTALPIGGAGTHAVLTGHSGLSTATLLTDLEQLEIGDTFTLQVLHQTMAYEVDQILVVEPDDISALAAVPGEDYVTLITCTPYAINSHRLLVRGTRIELPPDNTIKERPLALHWLLIAIIICVVTFIAFLFWRRRNQKQAPS